MTAVWSYQCINNIDPDFNPAELYVISASVLFWKKLNPGHATHLFCDTLAKEYFTINGLINIWDQVTILDEHYGINPRVFWASAKIIALSKVQSPVVHIDLDFFTWCRLGDFGLFDLTAAASFPETTKTYYEPVKSIMKGVNLKEKIRFKNLAYNTSLLYIGSDILKNAFCDISIEYMQKASLTDTNTIFSKDPALYMIFAEQQIFANIALKQGFKVKTILKETLVTGKDRYITAKKNNGIWKIDEAKEFLVHLGDFKKELRVN